MDVFFVLGGFLGSPGLGVPASTALRRFTPGYALAWGYALSVQPGCNIVNQNNSTQLHLIAFDLCWSIINSNSIKLELLIFLCLCCTWIIPMEIVDFFGTFLVPLEPGSLADWVSWGAAGRGLSSSKALSVIRDQFIAVYSNL